MLMLPVLFVYKVWYVALRCDGEVLTRLSTGRRVSQCYNSLVSFLWYGVHTVYKITHWRISTAQTS